MVTSGTTGVPKRVPIGRRAGQPLAAFALAGATRIRRGPGAGLAAAPPRLRPGGRCAVPGGWRPGGDGERPARGGLADGAGEAALAAIRRYGVEVVFGVPAQLRRWLRRSPPPTALHPAARHPERIGLPRPATVTALHRAFGPVLTNFYGSTEAGTFTMATGARSRSKAAWAVRSSHWPADRGGDR